MHLPESNLQKNEQEHEEHQKECMNLSEEDNIDMQNILDSILKKGAPDDFRVLLESQLSNSKIGLEKRQAMGSKSYKHMFVNILPFTSSKSGLVCIWDAYTTF